MKHVLYFGLVANFMFFACTSNITNEDSLSVENHEQEELSEVQTTESEEHEHEGGVTFTDEQASRIDFVTAYPEYKTFGAVIKTTGIVQANPTQKAVLTAHTNGIINFLSSGLVEGVEVSKQAKLFTISGTGMGDDNAALVYSSALTTYETEKENYERLQKIAEKQIVSQNDLLTASSNYEKAKAVYENLQENYSSTGQVIVAPLTGSIGEIYVSNGQYVNAGDPIATVVNMQRLQVKAEIQQKYVASLKDISEVYLKFPDQGNWDSLEKYNGKLLSIGSQINAESYLIPLYFEIENNGQILPGSFVDLNLKTSSENKQVVVPNSALIEQQGNFFVYVQTEPEMYEKCQVTIGDSDGTETSINSGVHSDDLIVTRGAVMVNLASSSGSLDPHAGHMH